MKKKRSGKLRKAAEDGYTSKFDEFLVLGELVWVTTGIDWTS